MQSLLQNHQRLLTKLQKTQIYERDIFRKLHSSHRIQGIIGSRGIGKTTYLLHFLQRQYGTSPQALYVSADNFYFGEHTILQLVEEFTQKYDGKLLCIDEIHRYPNWAQELKNIYDSYSKLQIIFSGSSSIDLIKQKYDLSRRATTHFLPGFSFREYLECKLKKKYPVLPLSEIIENRITVFPEITTTPKLLGHFQQYIRTGYYPFFRELTTESDMYKSLHGVIEKVIYGDIASYYSLKTTTLPIFKKILYFILTSKPSQMNIHRLAKSLQKYHPDVSTYLEMMRESGLLRFLMSNNRGHALIRKAEKMYVNNTNLAYAINSELGKETEIGSIRELFALTQLQNADHKVFYSPVGDISVQKYIFEIGGKNKTITQLENTQNAFLLLDDILSGDKWRIPLYLLGFLY